MYVFSPLRHRHVSNVYELCREKYTKSKRHSLIKGNRNLTEKQELVLLFCRKYARWSDIKTLLNTECISEVNNFIVFANEIYTLANHNIKSSLVAVLCENCCFVLPFIIATCDPEVLFSVIGHASCDLAEKESRIAFFKRIRLEWLKGKVAKCVQHPVISKDFREFMKTLPKRDKRRLLCTVDEESGMSAIYHGMEKDELKDNKNDARNITEAILYSKCWRKIRNESNSKTQGELAFNRAKELYKHHTVVCFRETMFPRSEN